MDFEAWEPFYKEIRKDFGFSQAADETVAAELDQRLRGARIGDADLRTLLRGKEVTVAGNGPNVGAEIKGSRGVLVTADEATAIARSGKGPAFIEALTYRHLGHSKSDPGTYRPPREVERWKARDPLAITRSQLSREPP